MGTYVNPSCFNFKRALESKIYIDKSKLIAFTNDVLGTEQGFLCVSRPRRFGKTMAADMLTAYYNCEEDSHNLFAHLEIARNATYEKYLNKFDVIKVDMQSFLNKGKTVEGLIQVLTKYLTIELSKKYSDVDFLNKDDLSEVLNNILSATRKQFVIIIDEWDCVMRRLHDSSEHRLYLDFLRDLLKNQPYVALAYMTGILPVKKYGEHSTLNMFREYSMTDSAQISDCFGFTEEEVRNLCAKYDKDFQKMQEWYDGYRLVKYVDNRKEVFSIYGPNSIIEAINHNRYDGYWTKTETYEALKAYIGFNFNGLKDAIIEMLVGNKITINTRTFQNDMSNFKSRDDVLTLLVHLGYLAYNEELEQVYIPNKEVAKEFLTTIENSASFGEVYKSVIQSEKLLRALWQRDTDAVSIGVEQAHQCFSSLKYNDENSLSCAIELAFYYAREYYTVVREMPAGKGFADICYIPKPQHADKPAIIVELKWDKDADTALKQIKDKQYPESLNAYKHNLILCGINYDKKNKKHSCVIE